MEQSPNPSEQQDSAPSSSPPSPLAVKLHELLDESDTEEGTVNLPFQEEMVEEVMQEFYKEITAFSSSSQNPSSSSSSSSSSQVFINEGKNGSCGASVSDEGSSVMAGIEAVGVAGGGLPVTAKGPEVVVGVDGGGERNDELFEFGVGVGEENNNKKMEEFFDGVGLDDEWLGRVLSWGQQNQVQVVEATQWF